MFCKRPPFWFGTLCYLPPLFFKTYWHWLISFQRTSSPESSQRRQRRDSRKSSEAQTKAESRGGTDRNRVMISNLSNATTERKLKTLMAEIGKIEVRLLNFDKSLFYIDLLQILLESWQWLILKSLAKMENWVELNFSLNSNETGWRWIVC